MPTWLQNAKIDKVSLVARGANRRPFTIFKQANTKTEDGVAFPAAAFAFVPDPQKPSTWKLRLWESPEKKVTTRQVGMAVAALGPGGFRGNRVQIPAADLPGVKAKVRSAWKQVHPDAGDVPSAIKSQEGTMPDLKELLTSLTDLDDDQKAEVRKALEMEPEDVFDKLTKATDEQKVALAKALGIEKVDSDSLVEKVLKTLGLKAADVEPDPDVPEAVRKAIEGVKGEVAKHAKRADDAEIRMKAAEDLIAKRDKEARVQTMVVKAAKYPTMGSPDDVSKLLTETHEKLGDEGLKTLEAVLAKGEEAFTQAKVFDEIGRDASGNAQSDVMKALEDKAVEIQKAAKTDMTIEAARSQAWHDNPTLYKQYQTERTRAIRAQEG